jgi:sRNA-binding regulator protein Hfq
VRRPVQRKKRVKAGKRIGTPAPHSGGGSSSGRPSDRTFEETKYLKHLVEQKVPVMIRLRSNEEFRGTLEYYDATFLRLTREDEPNLFIYKHDVKYLSEMPAEST